MADERQRWEATFHDMGKCHVLGEVEALTEQGALMAARDRYTMKRIRPRNRIFVRKAT